MVRICAPTHTRCTTPHFASDVFQLHIHQSQLRACAQCRTPPSRSHSFFFPFFFASALLLSCLTQTHDSWLSNATKHSQIHTGIAHTDSTLHTASTHTPPLPPLHSLSTPSQAQKTRYCGLLVWHNVRFGCSTAVPVLNIRHEEKIFTYTLTSALARHSPMFLKEARAKTRYL